MLSQHISYSISPIFVLECGVCTASKVADNHDPKAGLRSMSVHFLSTGAIFCTVTYHFVGRSFIATLIPTIVVHSNVRI